MAYLYKDGINLGPIVDAEWFPLTKPMQANENPHALYRITNYGWAWSDRRGYDTCGQTFGWYGVCKKENANTHEIYLPTVDDDGIHYQETDDVKDLSWEDATKLFYNDDVYQTLPMWIKKEDEIGEHGDPTERSFAYYYDVTNDKPRCKNGTDEWALRDGDIYRGIFAYTGHTIERGAVDHECEWRRLDVESHGNIYIIDNIEEATEEEDSIYMMVRKGSSFDLPEGITSENPLGYYRPVAFNFDDKYFDKVNLGKDFITWTSSASGASMSIELSYLRYLLETSDDMGWLYDALEYTLDPGSSYTTCLAYQYNDNTKVLELKKATAAEQPIDLPGITSVLVYDKYKNWYFDIFPRIMQAPGVYTPGERGLVPQPPERGMSMVLTGDGWKDAFNGVITPFNRGLYDSSSIRMIAEDINEINCTLVMLSSKEYIFPVVYEDEDTGYHFGYVQLYAYFDTEKSSVTVKEIFNDCTKDPTSSSTAMKSYVRYGYIYDWTDKDTFDYDSYNWTEFVEINQKVHEEISYDDYLTRKAAGSLLPDVEYFVKD